MNKHKDDLLPTLATALDAYVKAKVEEALMDERARSQSMHRRAQKAEAAVARVTQWLDVIENGTRGNEYYIRCVVEWLRKAAAIKAAGAAVEETNEEDRLGGRDAMDHDAYFEIFQRALEAGLIRPDEWDWGDKQND